MERQFSSARQHHSRQRSRRKRIEKKLPRSFSAPPYLSDTRSVKSICLKKLESNLLIDRKQSKRECESTEPLQSCVEREAGLPHGASFSPMLRLRNTVKSIVSDIERKNEISEECGQVEPNRMFTSPQLTSGCYFSLSCRGNCSTEMESLTERVTQLENSLRNLKILLSTDVVKKRSFVTNFRELFR